MVSKNPNENSILNFQYSFPTGYIIFLLKFLLTKDIPCFFKFTDSNTVMEWESVVNRVAKCELGEKIRVCGRAARWWDEQIKDKINARRQVYKKVVNGREDLWGEYCRLRKEVKQLVIEKKLNVGMSWLRK